MTTTSTTTTAAILRRVAAALAATCNDVQDRLTGVDYERAWLTDLLTELRERHHATEVAVRALEQAAARDPGDAAWTDKQVRDDLRGVFPVGGGS